MEYVATRKDVSNMYIYKADVWCDSCGESIRKSLKERGKEPEDPDDEWAYDSDDYPKEVMAADEDDCPWHCGAGGECLEAEVLPSGLRIGKLLSEGLTEEGVRYVREALEPDIVPHEVAEFWAAEFADQLQEAREDEEGGE